MSDGLSELGRGTSLNKSCPRNHQERTAACQACGGRFLPGEGEDLDHSQMPAGGDGHTRPADRSRHALAEQLRRTADRINRRECLDPVVIVSEAHLRRTLRAYASYYNNLRIHRSLNKDAPRFRPVQQIGCITSKAILGGLHHQYGRVRVFGTDKRQVMMTGDGKRNLQKKFPAGIDIPVATLSQPQTACSQSITWNRNRQTTRGTRGHKGRRHPLCQAQPSSISDSGSLCRRSTTPCLPIR
jgi:hypothetical protein